MEANRYLTKSLKIVEENGNKKLASEIRSKLKMIAQRKNQ
jgi:hypothetical protein